MYFDRLRFDGKVAIVLGASGGGMGTATTVGLAELGAQVVGVDVSADRLAEVDRQVKAIGGSFRGVVADVLDDDQLRGVFETAEREFGRLDALANVVGGSHGPGITPGGLVEDYDREQFDRMFDFNLRYAVLSSGQAVRRMVAGGGGGSIVNFTSMNQLGLYGMAKKGLEALTRTMALEYASHNIRVNCVGVGQADSDRSRARKAASAAQQIAPDARRPPPMMPAPLDARGRECDATEVAAAGLFLLSDLASFVTGQILVVDGGRTIRSPYQVPLEVWEARS